MTTDPPPRLRVFISYAQEDPAHSARVLALANALRRDGIATELDQYHQQELIDWPRWCREQLRPDRSDWVLLICTPVYKARVEDPVGTGPGVGRGVYWEGAAILNAIYADKGNARFVPLLLDEAPDESVPGALEAYTHFRLRGFGLASADPGYEGLYRLLTHSPGWQRRRRGPRWRWRPGLSLVARRRLRLRRRRRLRPPRRRPHRLRQGPPGVRGRSFSGWRRPSCSWGWARGPIGGWAGRTRNWPGN
ncbi:toll/interleukin-1 receptor domain-containing protein [uncultured Thiodictyon sp.]|jgi:hypothetical protein|uniref:toll/interleukin-1 receptor domain-containing protein n=1 Tax=uncultured Thiodictyon sp. TaxID=1846217 RepID=UPI0025E4EAA2|nr:toll/interleukin-1 receptor domain-containing protein [uncultured Thiodictyon sp.]